MLLVLSNEIFNLWKKRASQVRTPPIPTSSCVAGRISAEPLCTSCGNRKFLPETFQEVVDNCVERMVALPQFLNLLDGVNHGRMMLAAEAPSDLGQRRVRELVTQIHGDLPRHHDRLGIIA